MTSDLDHADELHSSMAALLAGLPPEPTRDRFQPLRLGLLGIWQYDEQEFAFHDGRMILRGRNGSGKTKVLEVTSPFLFDANLTARRLDPFGSSARSMRDNLLYGGRKHQIGYVWCEYGIRRPDGTVEYRTLGAGMRAQDSRKGPPDSWYFLTDRRIGIDFALYSHDRRPKNEKELSTELGAQAVFSAAASYRRAVAEDLFGLSTDRFRALVELLITLRRPKLSENFDVDRLTQTLSDGLPPIDGDLIDELARGFDELARDQEDLQQLVNARAAVDRFLDGYRVYARRTARHIAGLVRSAVTRYDGVTRTKRSAEEALARSEEAVEELQERAVALARASTEQGGRIRALEQRPEIEQHAVLVSLEQQASEAAAQAGRSAERLADATDEAELVAEELAEIEQALADAEREFTAADQHAAGWADRCALRMEHDMQVDRLREDSSAARRVLLAVVDARRTAVQQVRALIRAADRAQNTFDRAQATRDDWVARRDEAGEEVVRRHAAVTAAVEAVSAAVVSWATDCREVSWSDEDLGRLLDAVQEAGEDSATSLAELARRHFGAAESKLRTEYATIDADRRSTVERRATVRSERDGVAAERDPAPPEPLVTRRDRTQAEPAGAPLWRLLEFADGVPSGIRDHLEAALLGAGLLDAWVLPDGSVLSADTLDVVIVPAAPFGDGDSLGRVLEPAGTERVPAEVVRRILNGVGWLPEARPDRAGPWVSADGGWAVGPLRGRTTGRPASYIGQAAREEARRRRLRELDEQLAELDQQIQDLEHRLRATEERIERLALELASRPDDQPVREAQLRLDAAVHQAAELAAEVTRAEEQLAARKNELTSARSALAGYATEHSIDHAPEALDELDLALSRYREAVTDLLSVLAVLHSRQKQLASIRGRVARQRTRYELAVKERNETSSRATDLRAQYTARHELVGADVDRVLAELMAARSALDALGRERTEVDEKAKSAAEHLGGARAKLEAVESDRADRERERAEAVAEFDRLQHHGFLDLAGASGAAVAPASMTRSIDDARQVEQTLLAEDTSIQARNNARNLVDERFRELQREIEGPDWRPWGDNDGELFVVRISHNGEDHTTPRLRSVIDDEIDTRQGYLDDRERKLFADVLLGRVGEHLRECRVEAKSLVTRMNELLHAQPMASGLTLRLVWEPDPDAGPAVEGAIELLDRQAARFLTDEARDNLVQFLSTRVRLAREDDTIGDWKIHLREALDYRQWSRFRLQVRFGADRWTDLNNAKHQQGSGGEKAVMLQLPLFVAIAAHYEGAAPTAPRPLYLDEAFAGIDTEMRGRCMELLTKLDLDFIMASHDEWGFHAEVPGLATYDLYRDPATPGVLTTPFIWDGRTSHALDDPALRPDPDEHTTTGSPLFDE